MNEKPTSQYLQVLLDNLDRQWERGHIDTVEYERQARLITKDLIEAAREGR